MTPVAQEVAARHASTEREGEPIAFATQPRALTNRSNSPSIREDVGVGIDTITVRGPITTFPDPDVFDVVTSVSTDDGKKVTSMTCHLGRSVRLKVNYRGGLGASLEASVPNYCYQSNIVAASLTETRQALQAVYEQATSYLRWEVGFEELSVTRIDTVRDFVEVEDIPGLLARLRQLPLSHNRKYRDWGDHRGRETLVVGPGVSTDWSAMLYDKGRERRAKARSSGPEQRPRLLEEAAIAERRLRFEARTLSRVNRSNGLRSFGSLTEEELHALNVKHFTMAGYDREIAGVGMIKRAIRDAETMSQSKDLYPAISLLVYEALGESAPLADNTRRKYKAVLQRYGLAAASLALDDNGTVRLDHATGRVIRS